MKAYHHLRYKRHPNFRFGRRASFDAVLASAPITGEYKRAILILELIPQRPLSWINGE